MLEKLYGQFDRAAKRRGVFKVETIGDCYMAVTGLVSWPISLRLKVNLVILPIDSNIPFSFYRTIAKPTTRPRSYIG